MTYDFRSPRRSSKSARDAYLERRERRQRELLRRDGFPLSLGVIADRDNLYRCYRELAYRGGRAAGVDGLRYPDLSQYEAGDLVGDLSGRVLDKSYRPQPPRRVEIPKPGTTRTRTLSIPAVLDRVVAKAVHDALSPHWEERFLPCSWGFRPGKSTWGMLATVAACVRETGRTVLAIDDVRTAFDTIPHDAVIAAHRKLFRTVAAGTEHTLSRADVRRAENDLLWLVEAVLGLAAGGRGIAQGNNYSPDALNAVVHDYLDEPMSGKLGLPQWFRYADNVCSLVRCVSEGTKALAAVRRCLAPLGMSLRGEDGVSDLRDDAGPQLLGFTVGFGKGKVVYGLGERAWDHLRRGLERSLEHDHPSEAARRTLLGWVDSCGPAFESGDVDATDALSVAAEYGYRELATAADLRQRARDARDAWVGVKARTRGRR